MNEAIIAKEIQVIKEAFEEDRKIIGIAPNEMKTINGECYYKGDIFLTESEELIDLEFQMVDFDETELAKYVELAEALYEKNNVHISIYVLCPKSISVTAPECIIKSDADFTIKLASYQESPVYDILNHFKEKVDKKIKLNKDDIEALSMIPMMGPKNERTELRIECFKLLSKSQEY